MKILCVIDSLGSGGAQRQLVGLAIGFKNNGHQVSFLIYHSRNFFQEILDSYNIAINVVNEINYCKRIMKMRSFIRVGNFDIVLSFQESANFICELAGFPWRRWNLIVGERSANPQISKLFYLKILRWFHLFADGVVANSNENIKLVRKANPILPPSKCDVIYNVIDFDIWKPLPGYIPLNSGKCQLVVIASHNSYKNLNGVIEALHLLSLDELSKITVSWYGDGTTMPFIDNSFQEGIQKIKDYQLGHTIRFFPATLNIKEVIQNADVVGLFSFFEGFPNVICEGMACAKPIISSCVSDIPIILGYDDRLLFDPNKICAIKDAISYVLSLNTNELNELGAVNYAIAVKHFKLETGITKYLKLFENL